MPFPAFCPTPFPQAGDVSVQGKGSLGHFSWIWLKLARFRKNIHRYFSLKPQSVEQFKKTLRFLTFYYFLTSWKATYTLGILISNFKRCEKNAKNTKKGLQLLRDVLLLLFILLPWDLCSHHYLEEKSQHQFNAVEKTLSLEESHTQEGAIKARRGTATWSSTVHLFFCKSLIEWGEWIE